MFSAVDSVKPGFLNLKLSEKYLADYMNEMQNSEKLGVETVGHGETIIVDYGGAQCGEASACGTSAFSRNR